MLVLCRVSNSATEHFCSYNAMKNVPLHCSCTFFLAENCCYSYPPVKYIYIYELHNI